MPPGALWALPGGWNVLTVERQRSPPPQPQQAVLAVLPSLLYRPIEFHSQAPRSTYLSQASPSESVQVEPLASSESVHSGLVGLGSGRGGTGAPHAATSCFPYPMDP